MIFQARLPHCVCVCVCCTMADNGQQKVPLPALSVWKKKKTTIVLIKEKDKQSGFPDQWVQREDLCCGVSSVCAPVCVCV